MVQTIRNIFSIKDLRERILFTLVMIAVYRVGSFIPCPFISVDHLKEAFSGGGMFNSSSSPTLSNVTFGGNWATAGGGMFNTNSDPILTSVSFQNNSAASYGGGICSHQNSNPTLSAVVFNSNSATDGGGMTPAAEGTRRSRRDERQLRWVAARRPARTEVRPAQESAVRRVLKALEAL